MVKCPRCNDKSKFLAGTTTWVSYHELLTDIIIGKLIIDEKM